MEIIVFLLKEIMMKIIKAVKVVELVNPINLMNVLKQTEFFIFKLYVIEILIHVILIRFNRYVLIEIVLFF